MKLAATYYHVKNCNKRIQVHQGGTRSGKTYSILLALIELAFKNQNSGAIITIARKSFPSLRGSVMRDFFEILERENIYSEEHHNKSEANYLLFGNLVEFISVDQAQKVRGRKRDILFINEANELRFEDWQQLVLRTTDRVIIDYNPSDEFHWIYEQVIPRDDAAFFQTTYLDNPYLNPETIAEIERLKTIDEMYWRVYGLGERGQSRETIFQFSIYSKVPATAKPLAYGMDWGYANDPTALVLVYLDGDDLYVEELLYQTRMTNTDIADELRRLGLDRRAEIIADSAEPKSIDELHRMGFNIKPSKKGPDSVRIGIDLMRRYRLHVREEDVNAQKEFRNYKWMTDKNGKVLNQPVDAFNHIVDAVRYICLNKIMRKTGHYVYS